MNDLDLLDKFRADLPPVDAGTLAGARARMFRAGRPARRPATRWAWRVAPAAALALAAAVAVVAARPAGPAAGPGATGALDAPTVLRLAAAEALREPTLAARPDQFVYVESLVAYAVATVSAGNTGAGSYQPPVEANRRIWLSVDGSRPGLVQERPTKPGAVGADTDMSNVPLDAGQAAYLKDLPTDAKAMRNYLYHGAENKNPPDTRAFTLVGDTLREQYVPPKAVAALFDAAATIPGTSVVHQADVAGRHGIAVSRTNQGIRHDLIFDSSTYRFLGERDVAVGNVPPYPKNAVIGWTAQLHLAIVDRAGQLP